MKRILFVAALGLLVAAFVSGAPLCTTYVGQQIPSQGFACQIGDKLFSDFVISPTTSFILPIGNVSTPTSVTLQGVFDSAPVQTGFALHFNLFASSTVLSQDFTLSYIVSTLSGLPLIQSMHLGQTDNATVSATIGEDLYPGCTGPCANHLTLHTSTTSTTASVTFDPVSTVYVLKDLNVTWQGSLEAVSLSDVTQYVDQTGEVPEPATMALCGGSLIGLGLLLRRRLKRS